MVFLRLSIMIFSCAGIYFYIRERRARYSLICGLFLFCLSGFLNDSFDVLRHETRWFRRYRNCALGLVVLADCICSCILASRQCDLVLIRQIKCGINGAFIQYYVY